jgi:putative SOS response-associated peptidase YedK
VRLTRQPPLGAAQLLAGADAHRARTGRWPTSSSGPVESCAILTTGANELVRPVQDRMPVALPQRYWAARLDARSQNAAELAPLLRPFPL